MSGTASTNVLIGDTQRENKARTGSLNVKGRAPGNSQSMLKQTGCTWKYAIRRSGSYDDEIQILWVKTGRFESLAGRHFCHTRCGLTAPGDPPFVNTGPLYDPFIARIDLR
jgi:hypothetical protein